MLSFHYLEMTNITMQAIQIHQFGGPEVLRFETLDRPILHEGEVLIETTSIGVNPIDWKTRAGGGASGFLPEPPFILGWECAGRVIELGPKVTDLAVGDRVAGLLNFPHQAGCYATEVVASAEQLARVPEGLDMAVVGALPLAGLTAWQALFQAGRCQAGQRVLVLAGAGGVGHLAVQLAKHVGAWVAATASAKNHAFLTDLGCDQLIDYHQEALPEVVADIDLVIDGLGGDAGLEALEVLSPSGLMVTLPSVTAAAVIAVAEARGQQAMGWRVVPDKAGLEAVLGQMREGKLRLAIRQQFPLAEAAAAHQLGEQGHGQGKIVLTC